jgi:selenium metabolism protein YedF
MQCPKPLILTKKALNGRAEGEGLTVVVDNETAKQNVERFLRDNGVDVAVTEAGGVYSMQILTTLHKTISGDERAYCTPQATNKSHVICFRSSAMGNGPAELGAILMKAFVNTIKEVAPLPGHCVFYNTGVHLVVEGSTLIEPFRELFDRGVSLLACGTCLEYFNEKDKLKVGTVSNMFTILETLSAAHHVIEP